jgi:hypothetical protein
MKHIEEEGLSVEGIFRISPNKEGLDRAIASLERDGDSLVSLEKNHNGIHMACGLLKQYFR